MTLSIDAMTFPKNPCKHDAGIPAEDALTQALISLRRLALVPSGDILLFDRETIAGKTGSCPEAVSAALPSLIAAFPAKTAFCLLLHPAFAIPYLSGARTFAYRIPCRSAIHRIPLWESPPEKLHTKGTASTELPACFWRDIGLLCWGDTPTAAAEYAVIVRDLLDTPSKDTAAPFYEEIRAEWQEQDADPLYTASPCIL